MIGRRRLSKAQIRDLCDMVDRAGDEFARTGKVDKSVDEWAAGRPASNAPESLHFQISRSQLSGDWKTFVKAFRGGFNLGCRQVDSVEAAFDMVEQSVEAAAKQDARYAHCELMWSEPSIDPLNGDMQIEGWLVENSPALGPEENDGIEW